MRHREGHRTERIGWLRAAVLGANDGIVSTASHGTHRIKSSLDHDKEGTILAT
jgi:VIT1/CCC1 family predicted Fe2+/Mn2+ transporter